MASVEFFSKKSDGTVAKKIASGHVGEIIFFPIDTPPEHTLICNGAELSVSAYPELFAVLGTKYGGNGTATFRLPKAEDVIYAAGARHAVGEAVSEGLPNINGELDLRSGTVTATAGVFSVQQVSANAWNVEYGTSQTTVSMVLFNAAKGNPIYGASAHVTPAGIALLACIVYE
ncbi:phage tail protein [Cloacibacillus evryensis]|uniref:Phage tail protein n=1 Tax=Cloacibacillus evryensis TaxID=508460 RepID=A0AAW5K363_9BACT|nr:phage tail protein [Cloacibacillus evryensis]MCQ4813580.1 phage tail protein [Cloacibacillus evryensis]